VGKRRGPEIGRSWRLLGAVSLALGAGPAAAIEFWDERVQIHGFYESRMSFGWEDFDASNEIDMYGWLQVLNLETEVEIAPHGWGPFDMVAAFARVEVKYDCVWNHACGMLPSVDAFGNDPGNLPHRVQEGRRTGEAGSQTTFDRRPYWFSKRRYLEAGRFFDVAAGQREATPIVYGPTLVGAYSASRGADRQHGLADDIRENPRDAPGGFLYDGQWTDPTTRLPGDDDVGLYLLNRESRCRAGTWTQKAASRAGYSNRELIWEIDDCNDLIEPIGLKRHIANPFRDELFGTDPVFGGDRNPVLLAIDRVGSGLPLDANGIPDAAQLPLRPGSERNIEDPDARPWESQGLFLPNLRTRRMVRGDDFDDHDQNAFSLDDLQWNRGASQQEWKELRELYLELEAFESQLWVRAGKQTIVWGKTELFRNQDQWNPVDIAIGPLASLEEARIALWGVRGIWSFYEVGPLEDVRLELVTLYDEFEPTDLGRCGEPFVPRAACTKSWGLWVHGESGAGVAGEVRPQDPWNSWEGIEVGARIEFRYDRFSFALTDYWGYEDFPYVSVLFEYDRNVDPVTGRPRHTDARGPCGDEEANDPDSDCLTPYHAPLRRGESGDVVEIHSINQALVALSCASTVALAPDIDPGACLFTALNSDLDLGLGFPLSQALGSIVAGTNVGQPRYAAAVGDFPGPVSGILVLPKLDDAFGSGGTDTLFAPNTPLAAIVSDPTDVDEGVAVAGGLDARLSREQEALLGCGTFYFTDCDGSQRVSAGLDQILIDDPLTPIDESADNVVARIGGLDLANAEASVLIQSFPGFEGTRFNPFWDTTNPALPQPGTVDALFNDGPGLGVDAPDTRPGQLETGPTGTRFEEGRAFVLPGARYDPVAILTHFADFGLAVDPGAADPIAEVNRLFTDVLDFEVDPFIALNVDQYDPSVDGTIGCATPMGCRRHPFTGQLFNSEMAILSWNLLMLTVGIGGEDHSDSRSLLDRANPLALGRCSYRQPQYCALVSAVAALAQRTRNDIRAGGNGRFGRRSFLWAAAGDVALRYQKRNIVGFSMDFAEDATKSSWGIEFTYLDDTLVADNDASSGHTEVDEYNLTVSVDRPTFINFLNANRTFFVNGQLFMSYVQGYGNNMLRDGPFTSLLLLTANTGYFQDRFLVSAAGVYDFTSQSMAFLPSVSYRFTENFSLTVGAAVLAGKWKGGREAGINRLSVIPSANLNDTIYVENGISAARDLDNFFLRLRYTF